MFTRRRLAPLAFALTVSSLAALAAGCADDPTGPRAGTATIGANQGLDFVAGAVRNPGNFQNSDVYAAANGGDGLELLSGGPSSTKNRPIHWFKGGGGLPSTFDSFAAVPDTAATAADTDQLPHAKSHYGFVVETRAGTQVKGWIVSASETSVTIQFGPLAAGE